MKLDLHNNILVKRLISPQKQTNADTAIVSQIIDMEGYSSCELVIAYGGITDANVTFVTLVEDGNNSSLTDNAAVDSSYLLGTVAGATPLFSDDDKVFKLGYVGPKRYLRLTITPTGNDSGDINIAAVAILGHANKLPQSTQKN
jgi:hypothetical protein